MLMIITLHSSMRWCWNVFLNSLSNELASVIKHILFPLKRSSRDFLRSRFARTEPLLGMGELGFSARVHAAVGFADVYFDMEAVVTAILSCRDLRRGNVSVLS